MGCKALQSPDTLRQLNAIDRDLIEARVRAIFDLREMGDIPGMMKYAAPDIVCFPNDFWRPVAFPRPIQGYDAVFEVFRLRNAHYENLASEIHRLLVDGDQVAVHRTVTLRDRGGSDTYTYNAVDFLRFRDGLVVEFAELPDASARQVIENFPL